MDRGGVDPVRDGNGNSYLSTDHMYYRSNITGQDPVSTDPTKYPIDK